MVFVIMDDWKQNIRNTKRMFSRTQSSQQNGKNATYNNNIKTIKSPLNIVMNKVMKDSDSDTDNDDDGESPATAVAAVKRYKRDTGDLEWIGDPWAICAQPGQLIHQNILHDRRRYNVIVTCNNGRAMRRQRKIFSEVYLALNERDEYIELERQINDAVASYKAQDIPVPRRFFKSQMPVLAPFGDCYYRGRVVSARNNRCKVFFIDYGNEEDDVSNELIYPMQQHFALLPAMAFPAWILSGPKPLREGDQFTVIAERIGAEGIVQVHRYGPQQPLAAIAEIDELFDTDAAN